MDLFAQVTMVKEAAKLIFNKDLFVYSTDGVLGSACDDALHFVEHMMKSGNLTRPGVHVGAPSTFLLYFLFP